MGNDELLGLLRGMLADMLDAWVDSLPRTLGKPDYLNRLTDAQFDRAWAVVVESFLPYAVDVRGKDWPREPEEQIT